VVEVDRQRNAILAVDHERTESALVRVGGGFRAIILALSTVACESSPSATQDLKVPEVVDMAVPPPICDDSTIGTDAAIPATLDNVQLVFNNSCIGCHCCTAYLQLSQGMSYQNLVGRPAAPDDQNIDESCGGTLVVPGDAGVSYLYQKLSSQPCAGSRMPYPELGNYVPLPACEQDLIYRWISAGAPAQ
jgi:hypothetical protein